MRARHPLSAGLPRQWLMTDERIADLPALLRHLPRGTGVIFRHYATAPAARRRLFAQALRIARARGLLLLRGGDRAMPGEMGVHGRRAPRLVTWPAHDRAEAVAGRRSRARALIISPVFPTRSHPGARGIGPKAALRIGQGLGVPLIALGGMDARRFARLRGFHGWAAIDAWGPAR